MPLLVVGPLALDDVQTPYDRRFGMLGGSGAYAGLAASKYAPTALVSIAGTDLLDGDLAPLAVAGVDLTGVERRDGRTLRWSGTYADDFTRSEVRNTDLGVVAGWRPRIPRAWLDTPYVLLANTDPAAQAAALAQLRPTLAVLDTMEEWITGHRRALDDVIAAVGVVSVNERELALLTDGRGADVLRARGPRAVIVKRGRNGASLFTASGVVSVPAYTASPLDPTGAGDALAGAFTARLASLGRIDDFALRDALAHGAAAASFALASSSVYALAGATRAQLDDRARRLAERGGTGQTAPLYEDR